MSIECVKCGSRVHGCFPCQNCGCELPPMLTGKDAIIQRMQSENAILREALDKAYNELKHAYVFAKSREKMASTGLDLYLQTMTDIQQALQRAGE